MAKTIRTRPSGWRTEVRVLAAVMCQAMLCVVNGSNASAMQPQSTRPAVARPSASRPQFDVLLRGGIVIDGTGAKRRRADVAISGSRVAKVATTIPTALAKRVIDVTGMIVAPGFIDPHAHITAIASHPDAENFLRQGITTIFNSLHSLDQPYPLRAFLDTLHVAPNTLWSAGHTWARTRVMGRENRAPTGVELDSMRALVSRAMDDGAFGLGTGLEYIPATYAKTDELIALARASIRPGALYVTHLRDEGSTLMPAIREAITVGASAKLPVHISHIKSTGAENWGQSRAALALVDSVNRRGAKVSFDVYPYAAYSTYSDVLFPAWALADGPDSVFARTRNAGTRARMHEEMKPIFLAQTGGTAASVQFRDSKVAPEFAGRTLADYLRAKGKPETIDNVVDALIDLQAAGGFTAIVHAMSDRDIDAFLSHPAATVSTDGDLVTIGQGFPHPRSYGAFPRVLSLYVRDRHLLTLEAAIAKMTRVPAQILGLTNRGLLKVGANADIVVFDEARIADKATFTDPHHYSEGVSYLFINGTAVLDSARTTGARPGVAIRRRAP